MLERDYVIACISGPLTGNATTATTLETARKIQISGDMTGSERLTSANINISGTLSNSGLLLVLWIYNSDPNFTVDSKGRITSASTNTISTTNLNIIDSVLLYFVWNINFH